MKYIAYGSNMNLDQMARRCPDSKVVSTAELRGWKLVFNYHADIIPAENAVTPVLIWNIADSDWKMLDFYEGFPSYYVKEVIPAHFPDGHTEDCVAYVMAPDRKGIEPPSMYYYDGIFEGYTQNHLDPVPLIVALSESNPT